MTLEEAQAECESLLWQMEKCFKPHCKLTLLMRNPESQDGDLLMTRDDLGGVIDSIERFQKRELERPATEKEAMRAALNVILAEA